MLYVVCYILYMLYYSMWYIIYVVCYIYYIYGKRETWQWNEVNPGNAKLLQHLRINWSSLPHNKLKKSMIKLINA